MDEYDDYDCLEFSERLCPNCKLAPLDNDCHCDTCHYDGVEEYEILKRERLARLQEY